MDIRMKTTGLLLIMLQMYYSDFLIHHYEVFIADNANNKLNPANRI